MCLLEWRGVGIGWCSGIRRVIGLGFSLKELLEEVRPDAKGCHGEEKKEQGGVEGAEESARGGDEEDIERSDHGSDGELREELVGSEGEADIEPESEGEGPEEGVPVLEGVEEGVAEETEGNEKSGFFVVGEPAERDADYRDAHGDEQDEGMTDDAVQPEENVKVR